MIDKIIHFSIRNKFIIGLFVLAIAGWGTYSLSRLPIDAIPDITNNQVQIISIAPSLASQEVESFITAPVEVAVANIPDIIELRSISRLGLSVVTVVFKDGVDVYWARQQLSERLREAEESIPPGLAKIELAPVSTGLGEIYQYRLVPDKGFETRFDPMELRTIQDWTIRREMLGTPGVADINSYGGYVKEYEIAINPNQMRGLNLTLNDIFEALEKNNENTGSAYIDKKPAAFFIRGIGQVKSLEDIGKILIKTNSSGIPVLIRDIATVQFGSATRYGAFVVDTSEAVGGVVMMLKGANAHEVIDKVEQRIRTIQKSLPRGVHIEPYLNRSDLVSRSIGTVTRNLLEGALIVIFILVLLLGNLRAGLIVASVIPLSMLFAISLMNLFGVSGNLMSLGAIDFGLIVDGAVIIVESVAHRIYQSKHHHTGILKLNQSQMDENVLESARRMMSSATFGQIIILIVYLPIMALVGIEGKMFRPMAQVVVFALTGAALLSLTWVPMASALFLSRKTNHRRNFSDRLMEHLHSLFTPLIEKTLKHKRAVSLFAISLFAVSLLIFRSLGSEFVPQLEEGDLAAGVMTLQGGSLSNTIEMVEKANKILLDSFPEVKHAICKIGAGEIPTDPTPMETGDYIITLKDKQDWTSAQTREELVSKMEEKLAILAGVKFEFQQPIQMRFNELMSGSKQDIAVQIFGDDLDILAENAATVEKLLVGISGIEDINVEKVTGLGQVQITYNRDRLAQYGLSVSDVNKVLRTAFAGSQAGVVFSGEERFGLVVRLDKDYRSNLEDIRNLSIGLSNGEQIPIRMLADIEVKSGPAQVSRENTKRRITIGFNVRNRDIQSVINEVSSLIETKLSLPPGYYIDYGGQFQNLEAARQRLSIAVPVALLLIFVLLYFTFHSMKESLLIFSAVPMAAIGGVFALWIRDMNFSISAGIGFIALFGVAVLNGIVLISEFNRLEKEGISDLKTRVIKGLHTRLRPVIMTAAVASLGFLPMAISTSAGAEVQKPLATVVIGGLISATILTLFILPVFYILAFQGINFMKRKKVRNLVLLLTILVPGTWANQIQAQDQQTIVRISLKDAVKTALDSNLSIQAQSCEIDLQQALRGSSLDLPRTSFDLQYGQFNSMNRDNSFSISQEFSFPTVYLRQFQLNKAQVTSDIQEFKIHQLELSEQVKQIYWQLVYLQLRKKLLQYQENLFSGFLRAASLRASSGETSKLGMITARSQLLEVQNKLAQVNGDLTTSKSRMRMLVNTQLNIMPSDTSLINAESFSDSININENPVIQYWKEQVEIALIEHKLETSKALPDLSLGYFSQTIQGVQEINGIPRTFGPDYRFTGIQAGIKIPVWFGADLSKNKAARIRVDLVHRRRESMEHEIMNQLDYAKAEVSKLKSTLDFYEKQANPEANLILNQAMKSYEAGVLDYTDYALSLTRALEIQSTYLETQYAYRLALVKLEKLKGNLF